MRSTGWIEHHRLPAFFVLAFAISRASWPSHAAGLIPRMEITFLYVWLFNRTGGSALLAILFHNSQGTFTFGSFGFTGADAVRMELIYFLVVVLAVLATLVLDRQAWRTAPRRATAVGPFSLRTLL